MEQVSISNAGVKVINQKVKNVQSASQALNDVKIAILEIAAADSKSAVTIARSKYTVASRLVTQSNLVKAEAGKSIARELTDGISEVTKKVTDSQEGLLALKSSLLTAVNDETRDKFKQGLAMVNQKLAQLTVAMGDAVEKAAEDFSAEDKKFDSSLKGASTAGDVMSLTTELISVGAEVNRLIKEIFAAGTTQELDAVRKELAQQFDITASVQKKISGSQGAQLKGAIASLLEIRGLLLSKDGAADKLQHVLTVKAKALELNGKLKDLVAKQREEGKKGATSAQAEQAKAVKAVNRIFATNITTVSVVSLVVLILGIVLSTLLARLITTPIKELTSISEKFGQGDFSQRLDESRKDEFGQLAVHFNAATTKLSDITRQLRSTISELNSGARELAHDSRMLSDGAARQSTESNQAASAMTEMAQTIDTVAHNAHTAADESGNALNLATSGREVVGRTVKGMEQIASSVRDAATVIEALGASSARIGDILGTISDIADQTNLLALNAAIEAARAGEAGMGFAVVADEVRKLAQQTAEATKEISDTIGSIQKDTERSVKAMRQGTVKVEEGITLAHEANQSLTAIVEASNQSVAVVNQIAVAAGEQSQVATQVSHSVEQIATITGDAEKSAGNISRAAERLNQLADELDRMASWFKG
ncbi:MAG: methyl-accepting chemotaxis protein [Desulfuromonadaceae bacterium]|nr:methyl-accepting chemotaxis protein [Desulfuromonadaceae bacterium]MDD2855755.1 methyl-accepting chemotaxis protein [Desulfuromonadaceae bacterium]